jgi:tetratricopeptide (TPR) repeat protein
MAVMNPEDWNRIKQVFTAALAAAAEDRVRLVRDGCAGRPDLQEAVEELLRAHFGASRSFLAPGSLVLPAPWLLDEHDRVAGRFRVVRRIARGAMGEVYEVYDERLRHAVALKAIRPELIGDADTAERFRREVLVTQDIAHPGLCRVIDLVEHRLDGRPGVPDGTIVPCLTMQLLEGETLEDWLSGRRPIAPSDALPLITQIGEALQVLHDAGIVHRDLKPSNVMMVPAARGTRAVLTDFGLARPLKTDMFETQARVQRGAPYFMAPELFQRHRPSVASDVYAFGLLVDEMVTSRRAFAADSLPALVMQKLDDGPEPPSRRAPDLPRLWERVILRCLARQPGHRPESPRAVCAALADQQAARGWRPFAHPLVFAPRSFRRFHVAMAAATLVAGGAILVPAVASPPAVVITPFKNLTNRPELDYLAVGTASELGRRLSRLPNLRVYGPPDGVPIETAFPAALVVGGHVQEVGGSLRATVELTEAGSKSLVWSQNVDGHRDRALDLEEQLAAETVGALTRLDGRHRPAPIVWAGSLLRGLFRAPQLPPSGTASNAAFDAYLRARWLFEERTAPAALEAMPLLEAAVRDDPNFALAYSLMADLQGVLMDARTAPHRVLVERAERFARQAVALDPELADGHVSLGAVRQAQWRWREAEAAYLRAIQIHDRSVLGHRWYGGLLLQRGRVEDALRLYRRALELDPYDYAAQSAYGHALFNAGRPAEAAAYLQRLVARKDLFNAHAVLGQVYAFLAGGVSEQRRRYLRMAIAESEILRRHEDAAAADGTPARPYADLVLALAWGHRRDAAAAAPYVARLERAEALRQVTPGTLARVYAAQGDAGRAIPKLRLAEAQLDRELFYIAVSPHYAAIRDHADVRALIRRMGLSE